MTSHIGTVIIVSVLLIVGILDDTGLIVKFITWRRRKRWPRQQHPSYFRR